MDEGTLPINHKLSIPLAELSFRYSRSSGPGGQHAQKSSTRVELLFDVGTSPSLTQKQQSRILKRLASYIDTAGVLHLTSQTERSQLRNKEEVVARFQTLLGEALKRRKRRKPTKPTAKSKERRLKKKKQRSQTKKLRRNVRDTE
jgi:ribosome-associated protein